MPQRRRPNRATRRFPCATNVLRAAPEPINMQFVKTLFWVLVAVVAVLFGSWNWHPVAVNLWANLQADIKLPVLLLIVFLLGWLPTWLIMRAKLWTFRRRFEALERQHAPPVAPAPRPDAVEEPVT